jgi:hypothetical protein
MITLFTDADAVPLENNKYRMAELLLLSETPRRLALDANRVPLELLPATVEVEATLVDAGLFRIEPAPSTSIFQTNEPSEPAIKTGLPLGALPIVAPPNT